MSTRAAVRADSWGIPNGPAEGGRCKVVAGVVLHAPIAAFAIVGFLFWDLAGLVPAAIAALVAVLIVRTATSTLTSSLAPAPAEDARTLNLVAGLSADLGIDTPRTFIVQGEGPNALVFRHEGRLALGLTPAALREFTRTELEAVIAHSLVRADPGGGTLDNLALTLGGTFGACSTRVSEADDARAVAITRYPPALAKAIEKSVPASGRFAYLWFAADGPSHAPREARLEALATL